MWTIARFNWPFYMAAILVPVAAPGGLFVVRGMGSTVVSAVAVLGSAYFLVGSLGVSHLIYDRSDLYRWGWLDRALRGAERGRFLFCHSGFDESSPALRARFGAVEWQILDHFEEGRMTESSIRRARKMFPPTTGTLSAPHQTWPMPDLDADVIFGLLAIHELRSETERSAWFAEARRCLRAGGRVVLVEHVRDLANFLAFGPGFLHFHSRTSWRRAWERAGLRRIDEFRITPWVRVFVLVK